MAVQKAGAMDARIYWVQYWVVRMAQKKLRGDQRDIVMAYLTLKDWLMVGWMVLPRLMETRLAMSSVVLSLLGPLKAHMMVYCYQLGQRLVAKMALQKMMVVGKAGEREECLNLVQVMGGQMVLMTMKGELRDVPTVVLILMED